MRLAEVRRTVRIQVEDLVHHHLPQGQRATPSQHTQHCRQAQGASLLILAFVGAVYFLGAPVGLLSRDGVHGGQV